MAKVKKDFRKDIRQTAEFNELVDEIAYVINCMGEDIRRFPFESISRYKEQVKEDTDQILRAIDKMERLEVGDFSVMASTKKSKIKKGNNGQKCVNYLGMPVCPECGSPNLVEGRMEGDVTPCVCSRCYAKCWFNETDFDTGYGADHLRYRNGEVPESFIKSDKQKADTLFSDMLKKQRTKNARQKMD